MPTIEIKWKSPNVYVTRSDNQLLFQSDVFVAGVCLDLDGTVSLEDNMFDLYPGQVYKTTYNYETLPKIIFTLNDFLGTN